MTDNPTNSDNGQDSAEARISAKIRDLSKSELEHLSLSTKLDVSVEGDEKASQDLEEAVVNPVTASVVAQKIEPKVRKKKQLSIVKQMLMAGGILLVLVIIGGAAFLWMNRGRGGGNQPPNGDLPTGDPTAAPESAQYLSVADMEVDSDEDTIPDKLETLLSYDPEKNDCVRQIGCGEFTTLPRTKLRLNLVFVLDASGSMGEKLADVTKWDSAKDALSKVMGSGFPAFTEVGLVVYGHKGSSYEVDREVSCQGVEVRSPLQKWNQSPVHEEIQQLRPTGWTPLGEALRVAGNMLLDRQGEGNFVVVLSDGTETCGGNPVAAAQELHDSGIEVTTNVVGLAVSDTERQQLEAIAQAGGGRYFPANSPQELQEAVYLSSEIVRLWEEINQCIIDHLSEYGSCINLQYLQALNHVKSQRVEWEAESSSIRGTGASIPAYIDLERKLFEKMEQLRNENWEQYVQDLEQLRLRD